jgi:signal peptidase I
MNNRVREPFMGALLSIVLPGLGQLYAGKIVRGVIALLAVTLPAAGLTWYFFQPGVKISLLSFLTFLVPLAIDVLVIADSYIQVKKYNAGHNLKSSLSPGLTVLLVAGIVSALLAVNFAYLGVLLISKILVTSFIVPPDSMAPSIYAGERVFVDISASWKSDIKRGIVVVYRPPNLKGKVYIHRIVGLPGESVELKDHRVMINGVPIRESWCARVNYYNRGKFGQKKKPVTVPPDSYYVLGDASANSNDSRFQGFVPKSALIGRAFKIYYPFDRSGPV